MKKKPKKRTETVSVHSPTVPGAVEKVERVFDSIGHLEPRKGHKGFPLEYAVAVKIRRAHDLINGQAGGAGDFERVRCSGVGFRSPHESILDAAGLLRALPKTDGIDDLELTLIDLVVCGGHSIAEVTRMRVGPSRDRNFYGAKFREALRKVGAHWGWDERVQEAKLRGFASAHTTDIPENIVPAMVVHATGRKVFPLRRR